MPTGSESDTDSASDTDPTSGDSAVATAEPSEGDVTATERERWADKTGGDKTRTVVRGVGQTLITFGVVLLLFVVYELYITDIFTNNKQGDLRADLQQSWSSDAPSVAEPSGPGAPGEKFADVAVGDGLGIMRIPRFGADWAKVIVQGTGDAQLEEGPGHYKSTAMPGEAGNFAVAGHRVGKGSPFLDLDKLQAGDAIVVETQDSWYVYRVIGQPGTQNFEGGPLGVPGRQIVSPSDSAVLLPVPDQPNAAASQKFITLTTCHPKFSAQQRMIIHGVQEGEPLPKSTYPKAADVPALKGS